MSTKWICAQVPPPVLDVWKFQQIFTEEPTLVARCVVNLGVVDSAKNNLGIQIHEKSVGFPKMLTNMQWGADFGT